MVASQCDGNSQGAGKGHLRLECVGGAGKCKGCVRV
jgi:hypothetical protein